MDQSTLAELEQIVALMRRWIRKSMNEESIERRTAFHRATVLMGQHLSDKAEAAADALVIAATHPQLVVALTTVAYAESFLEHHKSQLASRQ